MGRAFYAALTRTNRVAITARVALGSFDRSEIVDLGCRPLHPYYARPSADNSTVDGTRYFAEEVTDDEPTWWTRAEVTATRGGDAQAATGGQEQRTRSETTGKQRTHNCIRRLHGQLYMVESIKRQSFFCESKVKHWPASLTCTASVALGATSAAPAAAAAAAPAAAPAPTWLLVPLLLLRLLPPLLLRLLPPLRLRLLPPLLPPLLRRPRWASAAASCSGCAPCRRRRRRRAARAARPRRRRRAVRRAARRRRRRRAVRLAARRRRRRPSRGRNRCRRRGQPSRPESPRCPSAPPSRLSRSRHHRARSPGEAQKGLVGQRKAVPDRYSARCWPPLADQRKRKEHRKTGRRGLPGTGSPSEQFFGVFLFFSGRPEGASSGRSTCPEQPFVARPACFGPPPGP